MRRLDGLRRDAERYLSDEEVEARPPSARYRLAKFVRRHKGFVLAASLVVLALLVGIAGTTWGQVAAETAQQEAERQRDKAIAAEKLAEENEQEAQYHKQNSDTVRDFFFNKLLRQGDPRTQADTLLKSGGLTSMVDQNPTIRGIVGPRGNRGIAGTTGGEFS